MKLRGYPKVYNLGHPAIAHLFRGPVVIQEKIDGSQFSFGVMDDELCMRSKRVILSEDDIPALFSTAAITARRLFDEGALEEGWIYRAEAMSGPKHNTLAYERAPEAGMVLFDVDVGPENRVPLQLEAHAQELGVEAVASLASTEVSDLGSLHAIMADMKPMLGGDMVEGVVIKNYNEFNPKDGKMLMGKLVQEVFRERHSRRWKKDNPGRNDIIEGLINDLRTEARWLKAVQHLEEAGMLTHSNRDIGPLMKEVQQDIHVEEAQYVKDALFKAFWKRLGRGSVRGLPEWYKKRLMDSQGFDDG